MSDVAIRVEGLGKQYRLGGPRERYPTLRDQVHKLASAPCQGAARSRRAGRAQTRRSGP